MPFSPASLVRRLSTALTSDSSGQCDLVELTYSLVLRNLLAKVQRHSARVDIVLRIIVPYIVLFGGIYGTFSQVRTFREIVLSLWNLVTAPFSSKITVPAEHSLTTANKATSLTLSGLLNCLDGPTSRDGRIVCMTTNAPDSLDPALIRPVRCDKKVLFGHANEEICIRLFEHLYTKTPEELAEGETSVSAG